MKQLFSALGAIFFFCVSVVSAQQLEITPPSGIDSDSTYDPLTNMPAFGQSAAGAVDPATGSVGGVVPLVSIGDPSAGGLVYARDVSDRNGRYHSFFSSAEKSATSIVLHAMGQNWTFTENGSSYEASQPHGATLTVDSSGNLWTLIDRTGAEYRFNYCLRSQEPVFAPNGLLELVIYPDGTRLDFTYERRSKVSNDATCALSAEDRVTRLMSVDSNLGYQIKFEYLANLGHQAADYTNHRLPRKVTAFNKAVESCDPAATSCATTNNWQEVFFEYGTGANDGRWTRVIDELGNETFYDYVRLNGALLLKGVRLPGTSSGFDTSYTYFSDGSVRYVDGDPGHWEYGYSSTGGIRTTTVTDPGGETWIVKARESDNQITEQTNPLGHTTRYFYNSDGLLTEVRAPEGNRAVYTYDDRGNVLTATRRSKSNSLPLTTTFTYPACNSSNRKICNQPSSVVDHLGVSTSFTYATAHGGVLTSSSPTSGTTTVAHGQWRAAFYDHNGALQEAWVYRPNRVTSPTGAQTNFRYRGWHGLQLLDAKVTGAGIPQSVTTVWYNRFGSPSRTVSPTGADFRFQYDLLRRQTGQIGPRPTGAGLQHVATRTTYDAQSRVVSVQQGFAAGQTNFGSFVPLETQTNVYANDGRLSRQYFVGGSTTFSAVDYSYDAVGRVTCSGFRMSALTTTRSACAVSSGSDGPDRVTQREYDAAGRITAVTSGYGTAAARTETFGYNANGTNAWVRDGRGNRTTYEYDSHDRLVKTRYPQASNGSSSSTSDFDQYTYNNLGQMTAHRKRDGQTINYQYDNLGRMEKLDAPGNGTDVRFTYDALGRISAVNNHVQTITYGYDVLSRVTSETSVLGTTGFHYDAAGRQTRIDYPGAGDFYATYEYDVLGAVTNIREKGSFLLATYEYDQLGRRKKLTRGNGVVTDYGFDAASRLSDLDVVVPNSTAYTMEASFQYNPAGQITREEHANAAFADMPRADELAFEVDDLNRYTSINASQPISYDARGNMTSDGMGETYQFDILNRLVGVTVASGQVNLTYDPNGRLFQEQHSWSGSVTKFAYAGQALISEHFNNGNVQRRYVHGPGADEPLVWYEGSGTGDKRYFSADERGSIVLVTRQNGTVQRRNQYDVDGNRDSNSISSAGRFGYTGQVKISGTSLWHYKARAYSSRVGRFLQTDPIGYGDGLNWYAYVGGDSVNNVDPSGECAVLGAAVGGLIGAGLNTWALLNSTGGLRNTDRGALAVAAATGFAGGALAGATCGASLGAGSILVSASGALIGFGGAVAAESIQRTSVRVSILDVSTYDPTFGWSAGLVVSAPGAGSFAPEVRRATVTIEDGPTPETNYTTAPRPTSGSGSGGFLYASGGVGGLSIGSPSANVYFDDEDDDIDEEDEDN